MPTPESLLATLESYVAAINSRDASRIAALFTEDAVQADPASQPANIGRAAIETFFINGIGASESWTFTASDVHPCGDHVAFHFAIEVATGGASMTISGIEVFHVTEEGLLASAHAYWGDADMAFG